MFQSAWTFPAAFHPADNFKSYKSKRMSPILPGVEQPERAAPPTLDNPVAGQ